jgi:oxaloacetate decarboxylase gamma subunit
MQNELIDQGLTLMLVGMGTVFVFLTTLVIVMTLMSWLVTRFQVPPEALAAGNDEVAAIAAAITRHRNKSAL